MRNTGKRRLCFFLAAMMCVFLGGCGKKEAPEKESTEVLKLTITPEATPTAAPEQVDARVVEKNGNLMSVNEYLLQNPGEIGKTGSETENSGGETSGGEDGYNSGDDYGSEDDYGYQDDYEDNYDSGDDYDYDSGDGYEDEYDGEYE